MGNKNYDNEKIIEGHGGPIPFNKLNDLSQIANNSICKIKYFGMGTGFFFQQNIQNIKFYNKYFLMTNNHVLNDNFFINNEHDLNEKQREYIKKLILANQKFERVIFLKTSSVMSLNVEPK